MVVKIFPNKLKPIHWFSPEKPMEFSPSIGEQFHGHPSLPGGPDQVARAPRLRHLVISPKTYDGWGPRSIAKLVYKWLNSMVYGRYNYS